MFEPNKDRQRRIQAIADWYSKLADGQTVSWVEAEQQTGIRMKVENRALVHYVAFLRLKRPYKVLVGRGFIVSSRDNANEIVDDAACRVVSAIDKARHTTDHMVGRHVNEMSQDQRNRILQRQAALNTIALSGSLTRKLKAAE